MISIQFLCQFDFAISKDIEYFLPGTMEVKKQRASNNNKNLVVS